MIKRALLIGMVLAGAAGAAVYFGLGNAGDYSEKTIPKPAITVNSNKAADISSSDISSSGALQNKAALDTAKTYGSGAQTVPKTVSETASETLPETSAKQADTVMKPRATATFIVKDEMANAQSMTGLDKAFKSARRITDKKIRDQAYLDIFDSAIENGHLDLAQRIGGKLSTPELREQASKLIAAAGYSSDN